MKQPVSIGQKVILISIFAAVVAMGCLLFAIPPALFPDPANGFQVLRSMHLGSSFNTLVAPDQGDIARNYSEFMTWWSPGQYLAPWFFQWLGGFSLGQGIAICVTLSTLSGLGGFYCFFRKIGFSPRVSAISLLFVFIQVAVFVPFVYYNGGEVLLFAFEGWFLYGCASIQKPGTGMVLFVLLGGWAGFFMKSSFLWIYAAGLLCLWVNIMGRRIGTLEWIKGALWVAAPAAVSLGAIWFFYLSRGQSPASTAAGMKLTFYTFIYPLASPLLSAFSIDDLTNGLIDHFGKPLLPDIWAAALLLVLALLSLALVTVIARKVPRSKYRLFLLVFYVAALLFFGFSYLKQLNISYEARHYRILGIMIVPGMIYLLLRARAVYRNAFVLISLGIAVFSIRYLVKGYYINSDLCAKGFTGIAQPNIDQPSLDKVMQLDSAARKSVFVFLSNDIGLEIRHNRTVFVPPVSDDLQIDTGDYEYDGFSGPLYIVLPKNYRGAKAQVIQQSFTGYAGFIASPLSSRYTLYTSKTPAPEQ